ncbi:Nup35 [Symbiodinium sp. CCMP2592]|nr:Nup35 [Symbiodinium sp. CCMP2592]
MQKLASVAAQGHVLMFSHVRARFIRCKKRECRGIMFGQRRQQETGRDLLTNPTLLEAFGGNSLGYQGGGASRVGAPDEAMVEDGAEEVPKIFSMQALGSSVGVANTPAAAASAASQANWPIRDVASFGGQGTGWGHSLLLHPPAQDRPGLGGSEPGRIGTGSCWVTVFGFPSRLASAVRQQLEAICGPIVEVCHGDGNFVHVCFASSQAANASLALNGQLLLGKLMVGCVPCTRAALFAEDGHCHEQEVPPQASAAGLTLGPGRPEVRRSGVVWRLLDQLFDI